MTFDYLDMQQNIMLGHQEELTNRYLRKTAQLRGQNTCKRLTDL